ncbi:TBC1 domain family member 10B-like [Xyrichtys novacula]|uniref:TBC1 domain family member 10B-like n=1 Tax=Xyrichtys novacula TaxID=13765 RepID=A0AAV1FUR1_XYRNO|nr:TBC1 domain family member 10B-like [Xyrichtys novacula]
MENSRTHYGNSGFHQGAWAGGPGGARFYQKKWENLKQKYKEPKAPPTGVSTEGGEATAANRKWFNIMDEEMRDCPTISPPNLITSSMTPASVASPPNPNSESPVRGRRTKESKESRSREWFQEWMKDFEEREDERMQQIEEQERQAEERKRQEKREMGERWARREREWREEDRSNTDRKEREWRKWIVRRAMEERREREERERESRAREERWMKLIKRLFNSK